jgi:hypothetical protein
MVATMQPFMSDVRFPSPLLSSISAFAVDPGRYLHTSQLSSSECGIVNELDVITIVDGLLLSLP